MELLHLIVVLSVMLSAGETKTQLLNAASFTDRIDELAKNVLGRDKIQELVDTEAQFTTQRITQEKGAQLADELAKTLSSRFAEYFTAVEKTKKAAENAYAGNQFQSDADYDAGFPECCKVSPEDLEYDARFFTEADPRSVCYRVSADAQDSFTVPATDELLQVLKQNLMDTPTLKWQYFGTEEGIQLKFPAHVSPNCDNYDPRFRPWYVKSSSPVPKDLILVIDSSGSMESNGRMEIAKDAARTVVETLNPNDRIGLVRFSSTASTPPGSNTQSLCYNTDMAYAVPDNVRYLNSYIQDIQAFGQTSYLDALQVAFDLLKSADAVPGQTRDKVILFLTDGEPTDSQKEHILLKIRELNSKMNNAVTIMTYGLSISNGTEDLLAAMARQDMHDKQQGDINIGVFRKIDSVENLRFDLGSYYSHFSSKAALEKPIITVPYVGFSGLGLITSICDTVLHAGSLKGVTCVDVRIADILGDIEYAQPGELSYTFIIDKTGRTLVHPLMPSPFKVTDDPTFIDIEVLERAREARDVIESMKSGGSGEKTFISDFTVGMGHSKQHGVQVKRMMATYMWRQIARTDLSFCTVYSVTDQQVDISVPGNTQNFSYHRFDRMEPKELCNYAGRLSTKDVSSVSFTDEAFAEVLLKDSTSITTEDITRMNNYMASTGYKWGALKDGVKDTVVLTEKMDAFWKKHNEEYARFVSARYIGSNNGMFRIYPGISLAINYSHTDHAWYSDAVANRDKLVMSVPYVDAFRAGVVTSIMHSILEGKTSHSASDVVIGAIGADVNVNYIFYLMMDTYPQCQQEAKYVCFLMDESGYLVVHPSLTDKNSIQENRHIIRHEPEIARVLIEDAFLVREECVSLAENKAWLTWRVQGHRPIERKSSFLTFELHWVRDTNVFIGIKDQTSQSGTAGCNCPESGSAEFKCTRTDAMFCECPCYAIADYDYCSNSFSKESLPSKTCTPPKETATYASPIDNEKQIAQQAPVCFPTDCTKYLGKWECNVLRGCSWCITEQGGDAKCQVETQCVDPAAIGTTGMAKSGGSGIVIGVVLAVLVLLAAGALAFYFLYWKKRRQVPPTAGKPLPTSHEVRDSYKYRPAPLTPPPDPSPTLPPPTLPPPRDAGYLSMLQLQEKDAHESIYAEIPETRAGERNSNYPPYSPQQGNVPPYSPRDSNASSYVGAHPASMGDRNSNDRPYSQQHSNVSDYMAPRQHHASMGNNVTPQGPEGYPNPQGQQVAYEIPQSLTYDVPPPASPYKT